MSTEPKATVDELFRVVMIDRKAKKKLNVALKDEIGDFIPIRETIEQLTEYISDKIKQEEPSIYKQQIMPLMAQSMVGGMVKLMGEEQTAFLLSHEIIRISLIHMMTVGFSLLKWVQKKNIKIYTTEEDISDQDLAMYERVSQATDLAVQGSAAGVPPKDIIKELIKSGKLQVEDLKSMGCNIEDLNLDAKETLNKFKN